MANSKRKKDNSAGTLASIGKPVGQRADGNTEKYIRFFQQIKAFIALFDYDCRFLYINPAGASEVGKPQEEIIGSTIWDTFPREMADIHAQVIREVINTGKESVKERER